MEFRTEITDINEVSKRISVSIPQSVLESELESELKSLARSASIKGFRPGKAPVTLVKKQYGEHLDIEVKRKAISQSLVAIVQEHKFEMIGEPDIDVHAAHEGNDFHYCATVWLYPRPTISGYDSIEVEISEKTVGEKEVDEVLERLQKNAATITPVVDRTKVKKDDVVKGKVQVTPLGEELGEEAGAEEPFQVALDDSAFPDEVKKAIVGTKVGEETTVQVDIPADYQVERLQGKKAEYRILIEEISERNLPALDDAFAASTPYEVQTIAELREKVKTQLEERSKEDAKSELHAAILEKILEKNDFAVPQPLVDQEIRSMLARFGAMGQNQQNFDPSRINVAPFREHFGEMASKRVRTAIVGVRIAEQENIRANDDDLLIAMGKIAEEHGLPLNEVEAYFNQEQQREQLLNDETGNKVLAFLESRCIVRKTVL